MSGKQFAATRRDRAVKKRVASNLGKPPGHAGHVLGPRNHPPRSGAPGQRLSEPTCPPLRRSPADSWPIFRCATGRANPITYAGEQGSTRLRPQSKMPLAKTSCPCDPRGGTTTPG